MARHLDKIRNLIEKLSLDGILIKSKTSKKYLDTLTGSGVQILITRDNSYAILDGRYLSEARERKDELIIVENTPAKSNKSHFDVVNGIFKEFNYSKFFSYIILLVVHYCYYHRCLSLTHILSHQILISL